MSNESNERQLDVADLDIVLQEVRSVLNYHHHLGIDRYPPSDEIKAFFDVRPQSGDMETVLPKIAGNISHKSSGGVKRASLPKEKARVSPPVTSLADISLEVESCTNCTMRANRVVPVPGEGPGNAKLLIVGEWLALPGGNKPPAGCLFGAHQDQMLTRMLEAIKLNRKDVFITNIIKCGVDDQCQPKAEHAKACFSYLERQILALEPQIICVMGRVATRMVLGKNESLSRLRGRLHTYTGPHGKTIPVIPTYHPSFLLQNPEMKKATWIDLQLLAQKMGSPVR